MGGREYSARRKLSLHATHSRNAGLMPLDPNGLNTNV
jgi:hypothetical protein